MQEILHNNSCWYLQAAHAVLEQQETGKPVYKVKNVSLNTLCRSYNAPVNPRKDQVLVFISITIIIYFKSSPFNVAMVFLLIMSMISFSHVLLIIIL